MSQGPTADQEDNAGNEASLRAFEALAHLWQLSELERLTLLGFSSSEEYQALRSVPLAKTPAGLRERVSLMLDIYQTLWVLLPLPSAAHGWLRRPNQAKLFGGDSALDFIQRRGIEGLREVRAYLKAEAWGN